MATLPDEAAYPSVPSESNGSPTRWHEGLTKREEFAKCAMMGLLANSALYASMPEGRETEARSALVKTALHVADDMIAELNKEPSNAKP